MNRQELINKIERQERELDNMEENNDGSLGWVDDFNSCLDRLRRLKEQLAKL